MEDLSWQSFFRCVPPQAQGGEKVTGEQIHEVLNEIDTNHNGQVEVEEYLQVRQSQEKTCFRFWVCALCKPTSGADSGVLFK